MSDLGNFTDTRSNHIIALEARIKELEAELAKMREALEDLINVIELGYDLQPMVDAAKSALKEAE